MTTVTVRGNRNVRSFVIGRVRSFVDTPADNNNNTASRSDHSEWTICKRYRVNPLTMSDCAYNPDFYRSMIRAGSIEGAKIQNWTTGDGEKIRAIQTMLHLQTNYNQLLMQGLYRQPRDVIVRVLTAWYNEISAQFPQYRATCEFELGRHLAKYDSRETAQFRFVA